MLNNQLQNHSLFRRVVVLVMTALYCYVTVESFRFAHFAVSKGLTGGDIAIVITALQALMTLMIGYIFKIYSSSRTAEKSAD